MDSSAWDMTVEIAMNDSVDSLPPKNSPSISHQKIKDGEVKPFRIAAFPDFIARAAILAMTSGRASNMMRRTPIGHVTRSSSRPSSSFVRSVTFPTEFLLVHTISRAI